MIVQFENIKNTLHISVIGNDDSVSSAGHFRQILDKSVEKDTWAVHITFYDACVLSLEIVREIDRLIMNYQEGSVKIYTLQRFLSNYLSRLGIKNSFVPGKTLKDLPYSEIKAISIGGSADSLGSIFSIIKTLPEADISVFVVQHLQENTESLLAHLLEPKTSFNVLEPQDGDKIRGKTVYVSPPGYHMTTVRGHICLSKEKKVNFARPSLSVLFESVSKAYGDKAVIIVLSGYGSDGSDVLKKIKARKTKIIVEDPDECEAKEMPSSCLKTGKVDYKFPIDEIGSYLKRCINRFVVDDQDLSDFLTKVRLKYGYDYLDYHPDSIKRRIKTVMINEKISTIHQLSKEVDESSDMFRNLFMGFSIPVSYFFRNAKVFLELRHRCKTLLETYPHVKIWCAGCAKGEEVYSLAIMLHELGLYQKCQIYATDINPYVLAEAKNGLFPFPDTEEGAKNYLNGGGENKFLDYFHVHHNNFIEAKPFLKENILFFEHSLVKSGILNEFQLILCRNVLIYFNRQLQNQVLKLFSDSLDISGILVLGDKEDISLGMGNAYFSPLDPLNKFFSKQHHT